ncbi:MAG: ferrous iron transport protein B [Thermodesulfovibrio sp. RBG_19FT_COMBO_42_12]|nr:MAG: ferrous iron transport protein B [Thermodesulfovibrio sp. RBG_19FT_COMBO_42_12]
MSEEKEITEDKKGHLKRRRKRGQKYARVILIGNPNIGKSVIFGLLTGKYVTVSNYPGTTVEVLYGNTFIGDEKFLIIDSPGVNNLTPTSEDEKITRDILLRERPGAIVLVADAKNLKRAIMLLIQLSEMELPCILDVNMEDEAKARGIEIDYQKLSALLNIEVVGTVAPQRKGIYRLKEAILNPRYPSIKTYYGDVIEDYAKKISGLLPEANISKRSIALMILSGDETFKDWLITNLKPDAIRKIEDLRDEAQSNLKEIISHKISHNRIKLAEEISNQVLKKSTPDAGLFAQRLGKWATHPVFGILFMLIVLFGFYEFVGRLGAGILVNFFEGIIFNRYLNPAIEMTIKTVMPVAFIQDMLVGHYGIFTMALTYAVGIILPITATFFLAFGILEDSGYLPRLAVMSNKAFKFLGLNGKAILPMVLGLGCCTMATMTTRILETKRERVIATFLIALTIPCSAQLGVIFGMLGAFPIRATLWWAGSIILILILSGYISSRLVPGEKPDFFIELPPMRFPTMGNIVMKTLSRIEWYLKEAVPLFILGTLTLFLLDRSKMLDWMKTIASPIVVNFLGLPAKATEAFLMGFLRRDYGAAGMFDLQRQGLLNENQVIVSLVTLTLFVPCLATFFMIIKERGIKTAILMMALISPFAILVGGILNLILKFFI